MTEEIAVKSLTVKVSVSYLGFIRDMTGTKEETFELPKPAHVDDLLTKAVEAHPRVEKSKSVIRVTINGTLTRENLELHEGDALSLMAPIVGG